MKYFKTTENSGKIIETVGIGNKRLQDLKNLNQINPHKNIETKYKIYF